MCMPAPPPPQIGDEFNRFKIVDLSEKRDRHGKRLVGCRCSCGNPKLFWLPLRKLQTGRRKSCGCSRRKEVEFGKPIGYLTPLKFGPKRSDGYATVICRCKCKRRVIVPARDLRRHNTRSCGCLKRELCRARKPRLKLLERGWRYGRLVVVRRSTQTDQHGQLLWECQCDCGNRDLVLATARDLNNDRIKSCGCLQREGGHHLPSKEEQRRRYDAQRRVIDDEGRYWRPLRSATKFLGVSSGTVLAWRIACPYLPQNRGIEIAEIKDGSGRTVSGCSEDDLATIKEARTKRRNVPVITGYIYKLDLASDLGLSREKLDEMLRQLAAETGRQTRRKFRGKGSDDFDKWKSYVPQWAAKRFGWTPPNTLPASNPPAEQEEPGTTVERRPPSPGPTLIHAVVLGEREDPVVVWGIKKDPLAPQTYRAVKALVDAGERGLSLRDLSRTGNWRILLKRLRDHDPDWHAAIQFPGKRGSGKRRYRIAPPRQALV